MTVNRRVGVAVLGLVLLLAGCATQPGSVGAPDGPATDAAPSMPSPGITGRPRLRGSLRRRCGDR